MSAAKTEEAEAFRTLAERLAGLKVELDEEQQVMLGVVLRMLTDPIERLRLQGGHARFEADEEHEVRRLESDEAL